MKDSFSCALFRKVGVRRIFFLVAHSKNRLSRPGDWAGTAGTAGFKENQKNTIKIIQDMAQQAISFIQDLEDAV